MKAILAGTPVKDFIKSSTTLPHYLKMMCLESRVPLIPKQNAAAATAKPKGRILSTEDDADTRDIVRLLLKLEGFEVAHADSEEQALTLASPNHFDLYLLDNWVPGLAGEDLCRKRREFDQTTPILFYSGAAHESNRAALWPQVLKACVVKPADPDELTSQIRTLINNGIADRSQGASYG